MSQWKKWFCVLAMLLPLGVQAASKDEVDIRVDSVLREFFRSNPMYKSLGEKAYGILVFPSVLKAGLVVGGEYGEGALTKDGKITDYYSTTSASFGFQIGAEERSEIIMFMDKDAFDSFKKGNGWSAGVDGSITVLNIGLGKVLNTDSIQDPIIAFVYSNKGFMGNFSLEGTKFTKTYR
jgi:lipid-binding SYLF domain-containing protein